MATTPADPKFAGHLGLSNAVQPVLGSFQTPAFHFVAIERSFGRSHVKRVIDNQSNSNIPENILEVHCFLPEKYKSASN